MIFILDTSNIEYIYLALGGGDKIEAEIEIPAKFEQEEKLLTELDKFLSDNDLNVKDLEGLVVVTGPGSFSALRIGLAVANTMAWQLNKKIVGFSQDEFDDYQDLFNKGQEKLKEIDQFKIVLPAYGREPNITINAKIKSQNAK